MADHSNLRVLLEEKFGHRSFRPGQLEAITGILSGRDVIVRLTTSGGKTICFQLATLAMDEGVCCIVISPLCSLMNDQVHTVYSYVLESMSMIQYRLRLQDFTVEGFPQRRSAQR